MKWTFEQKMAWIKAYKAGGTVPKPEDFRNSQKRWHDKIRNWIHVLEEFGADRRNQGGLRSLQGPLRGPQGHRGAPFPRLCRQPQESAEADGKGRPFREEENRPLQLLSGGMSGRSRTT